MSLQIVASCPVCGGYLYTYPTYPVGFKKVHASCNCFEVTEYCFDEYYKTLEHFAREEEEDDG